MAKKKTDPAPLELNLQRELFCRYLTQNSELFGQATLSYAEAYTDAADLLGSKFLAESKQPDIKVTCTIIDNADGVKGYDIESIQPGETCRFVGYGSGLAT